MQDPDPTAASRRMQLADRARAAVQPLLDRQLGPLGRRAIAALELRPGGRVLDVGCGAGSTVLELANQVGRDGVVQGVDVSAASLDSARAQAGGAWNIRFVQGDAGTHPFEPASFDAVFSRFGVMFFAEPVAAFANLRRALKPGGRLAFVCWRALEANHLDAVPLMAAAPHLPAPLLAGAGSARAFAFAEAETIRTVLDAAEFDDVQVTAFDQKVGCGDVATTLAVCLGVGSLGAILREHPQFRERVEPAVREALLAHDGQDGVTLNAATWIVTARRGAA